MLQIDTISHLSLTLKEVCSLDSTRLSNPEALQNFSQGISLNEDFLLNDRWTQMRPSASFAGSFDVVMFEMLPTVYDAVWLERLGGHFAIRITDVGDYTLVALNDRVVTLSGLPSDLNSGAETIDVEIAPDIFLAYCRGLLLDVAESMLEGDDEFEDREIGGAELLLNGMPTGGYGSSITEVLDGNVGRLDGDGTARSAIDTVGDRDWFEVQMTAGTTYQIDLTSGLGKAKLADPYLFGVYGAEGRQLHWGDDDSGVGKNARIEFTAPSDGTYYVSAGGYNKHTGNYELSVQEKLGELEAGPDIGNSLKLAREGDVGRLDGDGTARSTIDTKGDEDWFEVQMTAGTTYQIDLRGSALARGSLEDPLLTGVYDTEGRQLHWGDDDSGFGKDARIRFTASADGAYYVSAGGYGKNIGTYEISVQKASVIPVSPSTNSADVNAGCIVNAVTCAVNVGTGAGTPVCAGNVGSGSGSGSGCGVVAGVKGLSVSPNGGTSVCVVAASASGATASAGAISGCVVAASVIGASASASGITGCGVDGSVRGVNASVTGMFGCGANIGACGGNASVTGSAICGGNISACGSKAGITGAAACGSALGANGATAAATGIDGCGAAVGLCGAQASASGVTGCGAAGSICGAKAKVTGIAGCGVDSGNCGVKASASGISGCGGNAGACGALASAGAIQGCGANASACGAAISSACAAYAVACGLDAGFGVDVGGCAINVIPVAPSC